MTIEPTRRPADLVAGLQALQNLLAEHCRRVITGEPVRWAGIGMMLELAACHCHERADIELALSLVDPPS